MSTKRLFFFCAEYARREGPPVQIVGASRTAHVLGICVAGADEDVERLVKEQHTNGIKEIKERPEEWAHVGTTYREIAAGELEMMRQAVMGGDADE